MVQPVEGETVGPVVSQWTVPAEQSRQFRGVSSDGVVVGLSQVQQRVRGDGVLDVDEPGHRPAVRTFGDQHVALMEVVVAEHRVRAVGEQSGPFGDVGLHNVMQRGVAAEFGKLTQLLGELATHIGDIAGLRIQDPAVGQVAVGTLADAVNRRKGCAELTVDLVGLSGLESRTDHGQGVARK